MKLTNKKTSARTKANANKVIEKRTRKTSSSSSTESVLLNEPNTQESTSSPTQQQANTATITTARIHLPTSRAFKPIKSAAVSEMQLLANKFKSRMSAIAKKITKVTHAADELTQTVSTPPSPILPVTKASTNDTKPLSIDTTSLSTNDNITTTIDAPLSPPTANDSPTTFNKISLPDTPVSLAGHATLLAPAGHWSENEGYKPRLNSMKVLKTYLSSIAISQEVPGVTFDHGSIDLTCNNSNDQVHKFTEQQKQARTVSTLIEYIVNDSDDWKTFYQQPHLEEESQVLNKQKPNKESRSHRRRRPGRPSRNTHEEQDKLEKLKMQYKQKQIIGRKRQRSISSSQQQDLASSSLSNTAAVASTGHYTTTASTSSFISRKNRNRRASQQQADQEIISCICNYSNEEFGQMIQCDDCKHWLHMDCLELGPYALRYSFRCPPCHIVHGTEDSSTKKITSALTWRYEALINGLKTAVATIHSGVIDTSLVASGATASVATPVIIEEEDDDDEDEEYENLKLDSESEESDEDISALLEEDIDMEESEEEEEEEDQFVIAEQIIKEMDIDHDSIVLLSPSSPNHDLYEDASSPTTSYTTPSEVSTPTNYVNDEYWFAVSSHYNMDFHQKESNLMADDFMMATATTATALADQLPSSILSQDIIHDVDNILNYF